MTGMRKNRQLAKYVYKICQIILDKIIDEKKSYPLNFVTMNRWVHGP